MKLKDHDLKQIDRDYLGGLAPAKLVEVSLKLLEDLKEARDRLNQTPQNSSRPSGSFALWEDGIVSDGSPVEEAPDKEPEEEETRETKRSEGTWSQSRVGSDRGQDTPSRGMCDLWR